MAKRTVVRTRFEAFLHWVNGAKGEPSASTISYARYLFDGYECAKMPDDVFVKLLMFR